MSETIPTLRPGWKRWRFDQIATNIAERVEPSSSDSVSYVGLEHLDTDSLRVHRWGSQTNLIGTKLRMRKGDILFARRNAYLKRVAIAPHDGLFSAHGMVLRAKPEVVLPEFLPFFMQSDVFMNKAIEISVGSLSPTVNWKALATQVFALPPIHVQERQVALLRNHDELVGCLLDTAVMADRARRAALLDAFRPDRGSIDTFPSNWEVLPAEELGDVQLGQQRHPKYESGSNMRPYLRVANVFDGWIDFSDVNEMHFPEREVKKFELLPGDILLNEGQSFDLVGRSAIYRGGVSGLCCQKTLIRFRCGSRLLPDFAQAYFQHRLYTGQFAAMCVQTTSMAHLTAVRFSAMKMPVPPLDEQNRIANTVAILSEAASAIQRRLRSAKALGVRIGGL